MRRPLFVVAVLTMVAATAAFAQPTPSPGPSEGLELLKRVAQHYAEAKSYYIEVAEENTSSTEYNHSWQKTVLTAAAAPGNRFHFEGHTNGSSAMKVADGKTVWIYRLDEHRYTAKPQSSEASGQQTAVPMSEGAMWRAEQLIKQWSSLIKTLKSADRLGDATLMVNGHEVHCSVVHVQSSDLKRVPSNDYVFDETIWIDKTSETVLRTIVHMDNNMLYGAARIPVEEEMITTFTITELNGQARENLFSFIPPPDAKLMQNFPDPAKDFENGNLTGKPAPSLKLKSEDAKVVTLDSFRGKPVLLDFWATWCGPCVAALPKLAQIYQEAKDKGLVLLTVDQDEEPNTAAEFLAKKGFVWLNFHDGDGEIEKLVGRSGIPRTMLVDAQGKVVYDTEGMDDDELRKEIAKLGPEYAPLLPKPKQTPCVASK
ncbi:TlpA disulfide reductase family protein [Edaphobacter aggregans]|uniref:TlpA disulfide reductase family protein n=1 Tax=Edaphobacter aggregans TaxID=570835 RepID=UPI00068B5B2E|nr:TlpA disulfide reductase family protein [Edaphobacter aggregans]